MTKNAFWSKRVQLLGAMMLASGMPLGFVFNSFQIFLRSTGVDLTTIGLFSIVSVPWSLKFLWSPLVDRYALRFPDRRRSWVLLAQLGVAAAFVAMALHAAATLHADPASGAIRLTAHAAKVFAALALVLTIASATQDIALDAYSVEVLHPEEQAPASGLRIGWYRVGMLVAGAGAITAAEWLPWPAVFGLLAAVMGATTLLTLAAAPPERASPPPRSLSAAVVQPFRTFFARREALVIAGFLLLYKFGDNAAGTMVNPFLADMCFSKKEIGFAVKTIGFIATVFGSGFGAWLMGRLGLARSLWVFGVAQAAAIGLYALAAASGVGPMDATLCAGAPAIGAVTRGWTYVGIAAEYASQGLGTAALLALLLRVCDKRYSATQYALLSSLFGLGRTLAGLPSGWLVKQLGYTHFFLACMAMAIPGLLVLQLLAPLGRKEIAVETPAAGDAPPA